MATPTEYNRQIKIIRLDTAGAIKFGFDFILA